jgi:hypothetical protein
MELGAFAGNQVRGSVKAIYVAPLQAYLFFLTVYANTNGELVHYKLYDSNSGEIQNLNESMYFSADLHQGAIQSPLPFTLGVSGTQEQPEFAQFDIMPNPFHTETIFRFQMETQGEALISISDINGKIVNALHAQAQTGWNQVAWRGKSADGSNLPAGVYFVRLQTEKGSVIRKVILQ